MSASSRRLADTPEDGLVRRWFGPSAGTPAWRLAIDVPRCDAPESSSAARFRDALLLDEHGTLLEALAACLDADVDWRPLAADDAPLALTLAGEGDDGRRIALGIAPESGSPPVPVSERELAARSAAWRGRVSVHPHRRPVELVLDTLSLGADDVVRCAPGSVVLLPASFGGDWRVAVRVTETLDVPDVPDVPDTPGTLDASGVSDIPDAPDALDALDVGSAIDVIEADLTSAADAASADTLVCQVVFEERFDVAAGVLETTDVAGALDEVALARVSGDAHAAFRGPARRRCRLLRADGAVARGELVALGSGYAVAVDGVERWT